MNEKTPKPNGLSDLQATDARPRTSSAVLTEPQSTISALSNETSNRPEQFTEILESIRLHGGTGAVKSNISSNPVIIGSHNNIRPLLNLGSGLPKLHKHIVRKFKLILSQPEELSVDRHEIRCCLCRQIITFPCWYYNIKYAVNHFHYFICFDSMSSDKPSTRCYRRD